MKYSSITQKLKNGFLKRLTELTYCTENSLCFFSVVGTQNVSSKTLGQSARRVPENNTTLFVRITLKIMVII